MVFASSLLCSGQKSLFKIEEEQGNVIPDTSDFILEEQVEFSSDKVKLSDTLLIDNMSILEVDETSEEDNHDHDDEEEENNSTVVSKSAYKLILADSIYWSSIDSLYYIFDSTDVDPYGIDPGKMKHTKNVFLFDSSNVINGRRWSMPLDSSLYITSHFGSRSHRWHYGTDLRLKIGDTVRAVFDGVIRISKNNPGGFGLYVMVRHHNGLETIYGHLSKRLVKVGQIVKAGDVIGLGGNTGRSSGPHLHFEFRYRGDAFDSEQIFDFQNRNIRSRRFSISPKLYEHIREMRKKQYHKVRRGDTLSGLAVKYRTSVRQICKINRITTRTVLKPGRLIRVK